MKTGRLMKFQRPGADVQAYIYRDVSLFRANLYLMGPGHGKDPVHTLSAATENRVEDEVRSWVELHFPKSQ
jgi:hypothetical protein